MRILLAIILTLSITACGNSGEKGNTFTRAEGDTLQIEPGELRVKVNTPDTPPLEKPDKPDKTEKGKSDETNQEDHHKLLGKWVWLRTECCGRRKTVIADTSDLKTYLVFEKDGKVKVLHGKQVVLTADYDVETESPIYPNRNQIKMSHISYPALATIVGEELELNWEYMDLQIEFYKKVK